MEKANELLEDKYAAQFACALIQTKQFNVDDFNSVLNLAYEYADAMVYLKSMRKVNEIKTNER